VVASALIPPSSDFAGRPLRGWIMTCGWGGKMLRVKQCRHMVYYYWSEHYGLWCAACCRSLQNTVTCIY
jgi:hypothetical protein